MHPEAFRWVAKHVPEEPGYVIEVGGRDINGGVRQLLVYATTYISVDIVDGPGVDVVADASQWVAPQKADLIVCCEMLEHTPSWRQVVQQCAANLKSGGLFVMTCATWPRQPHSATGLPQPEPGEWYGNVSPGEFCSSLERVFERYTVDVLRGDLRCVAVR